LELAKHKVATAAGLALEAVSPVPSQADPLASFPKSDVGPNRIDPSGDFMAWHSRILNSGPVPFFHQRVAMADAASFHLNAYLSAAGLWNWAVNNLKIPSGLAHLYGFHAKFLSIRIGMKVEIDQMILGRRNNDSSDR